jgi:hypothetical protein
MYLHREVETPLDGGGMPQVQEHLSLKEGLEGRGPWLSFLSFWMSYMGSPRGVRGAG